MSSEGRSSNGHPGPAQQLGLDLARCHVQQGEAALAGIDELKVGQHEAERRHAERDRIAGEIEQLLELRTALKVELEMLVHDPCRFELVPDDAPPGSEQVDVDLEEILREEPPAPAAALPPPVRGWVLNTELAYVSETSRATVDRWLKDLLPRDPRRRPWNAGEAPVDESIGKRYRRIWVADIRDEFWPSDASRRRLAEVLSRWPEGQGWTRDGEPLPRCHEPFVAPDGSVREMSAGPKELEEHTKGDTNG